MTQQNQNLKMFLDVLFPALSNEYIEIRLLSHNEKLRPAQFFFNDKEEVIKHAIDLQKMGNYDLHFGVCPRNNNKHGDKDSISNVSVLWVDLDAKDFSDNKENAFKKIVEFKLPPTLIVDSGHGYHAYWGLKDKVTDKDLAEKYLKALAEAINADPTSAEISRVLRLPDTLNTKKKSEPLVVKLIHCKPEAIYSLNNFDFVLETVKEIGESGSLANQIMKLVEEEVSILFHDQYHKPYAVLSRNSNRAIGIGSDEFELFIKGLAWKKLKKHITKDVFQKVIGPIIAQAIFDKEQLELHLRVAMQNREVFYDLGNGKVVRVSSENWSVDDKSPVLFKQHNHQKQQVTPVAGGKLTELLDFINLPDDESERQKLGLLLLCWVASAFIPGFPHPVLVLHGSHGSAKSTLCALMKSLIDPSEIELTSPPTIPLDFIITCSNHWVVPIDNLSSLSEWLSDAICRATTGGGNSKRGLFTDSDEIIYKFRRIIEINGINLVVDKPDLLNRSLLIELQKISDDKRRSEHVFWKAFESRKPFILGALFDVLSKALKEHPTVILKEKPRMADFTEWGVAISRALGYDDSVFINAYYENIGSQHELALGASVVAQVLVEFMKDKPNGDYVNTPTGLYQAMSTVAEAMKLSRSKDWPKDASWLWRKLVLVKNNLEAFGLTIFREENKNKKKERAIIIQKIAQNAVDADNAVDLKDTDSPTASA